MTWFKVELFTALYWVPSVALTELLLDHFHAGVFASMCFGGVLALILRVIDQVVHEMTGTEQ